MTVLILGLIVFFAPHSTRIVAEDWRARQIANRGELAWKAIYSLASIAGFVMILWGYGLARAEPVVLWSSPVWTRYLAVLLTIPAFVLLAAAYLPSNRIKAAIGHPMIVGVKVWAFAHLIAGSTLADVMLFGAFLVWSVLSFRAARRRDRVSKTSYAAGSTTTDVIAVVVGLIVWAVFAFYLHVRLIGVPPI